MLVRKFSKLQVPVQMQRLGCFFASEPQQQKVRKSNQSFMKTDNALNRIKYLMNKKNDSEIVGLKVGLTKRGCNGLTYSMNYIRANEAKKFDEVVQLDERLQLVIDNKAIMAIIGTELDYVESEIGSEFVFNNPNEKGRCGCGESFHI